MPFEIISTDDLLTSWKRLLKKRQLLSSDPKAKRPTEDNNMSGSGNPELESMRTALSVE